MMARLVLRVAFVTCAIGGLAMPLARAQAQEPSGIARFRIVSNLETIPLGAEVSVDVVLDESVAYRGYQVKLVYDDETLDAVDLPANWNSRGASGAGNLAVFRNGPDCFPPGAESLQDNHVSGDTSEDDTGENSIYMACLDDAVALHTDPQPLVRMVFRCDSAGTAAISLAGLDDPQGGTFVIDEAYEEAFTDPGPIRLVCGSSDVETDSQVPATLVAGTQPAAGANQDGSGSRTPASTSAQSEAQDVGGDGSSTRVLVGVASAVGLIVVGGAMLVIWRRRVRGT